MCVRVCALQGSVGTGVQVLSVSHKGIKLLKMVRSSSSAPDYFRVLRPYRWISCGSMFSSSSLNVLSRKKRLKVLHWFGPRLLFCITSRSATRTSCSCPFRLRTCWSSTWPTRSSSCSPPRPRRSSTWSTTSSQSLKRSEGVCVSVCVSEHVQVSVPA